MYSVAPQTKRIERRCGEIIIFNGRLVIYATLQRKSLVVTPLDLNMTVLIASLSNKVAIIVYLSTSEIIAAIFEIEMHNSENLHVLLDAF